MPEKFTGGEAPRTLLQILKKYEPGRRFKEILESASDFTVRADKERRMLEISAHFPAVIDKEELYSLEEEIRQAYDLALVRLLPHYPASFWTQGYISNLLAEAERVGIVARGFFKHYQATLSDDRLLIELPFQVDGIRLMENAHTPEVIEGIVKSEFGVNIHVTISHNLRLQNAANSYSMERRLEALDQQIARAETEYDRAMEARRQGNDYSGASAPMDAKEEKQTFPRTPSVYFDEIPEPELTDDGRCRIGHATYDISAPELLIGQSFDIRPVTIASLTHPQKGVILLGEIFGYSAEAARNSDKYNVVFDIFDGVSCMEVKKYGLTLDEEKELSKLLSNGTAVAMQGYIKKETRKNYTDIDFTFFYSDVLKIKKLGRMDKAEKSA